MSQTVQAQAGEEGVVLPDGWVLDGGDQVTISDQTWAQVLKDDETLGRLVDLGFTGNQPDPVPTFRDMQRAVAGSDVGLGAEIDALNVALADHVGDTTGVHGIANTALLETQAGAQNKADTALGAAKAYTNVHASQTTNVHGIADTAVLADHAYVDTAIVDLETEIEVYIEQAGGYTQVFNFPVAAEVWTITHNWGTYAVTVETFTNDDQPIEGNVIYDSDISLHVEFSIPVAGYARAWASLTASSSARPF